MTASALPVALDAMGGDYAPKIVVEGALLAAAEGIRVRMYGRSEVLEPMLVNLASEASANGGTSNASDLIDIIEAPDVIEMTDDPARAARNKKASSLMRSIAAVREKTASAIISAGNTGAVAAGALLSLRRLRGVARPAIATPLPIPDRLPVVLLDSGAMADCQPAWLHQFARMGSTFFNLRYGTKDPKVGLMSIGEEPAKGSSLIKATHKLLADDKKLNFIGNIEGHDLLDGVADVIVTDGFTGNVVLKVLEGSAGFFTKLIMNRLGENTEIGPAALELLAPLAQQLRPEQVGGAMLLGVRGVCIISHGSSSPLAICNAAKSGYAMAEAGLLDELADSVQGIGTTNATSNGNADG